MNKAGGETQHQSVLLQRRSGPRRNITLRMAPMIDIIFLLLIFFLVAGNWRPQEDFLPFKLPLAQAQSPVTVKPEPLTIHILTAPAGCQIRFGQTHSITIQRQNSNQELILLLEKLKQCLLEQKRFAGDPVEIICEPQVKWDYIAKIYNTLYGAGLTDITFRMTD